MATAKTLSTKPFTATKLLPSVSEKGVVSTLLHLLSTLVRKNGVQVALQAESALFDSMMEELKASRIQPQQVLPEPTTTVLVDAQGQISTTQHVPNSNLSKFHVILDIDGTLVQTVAQHEGMIFGEPDYEDFELRIITCALTNVLVSLWTAGTQEYAEFIARSIAPKGYQFMFVLSRVHCKDHPILEGSLVKDMNDLWSSDIAKTFNINAANSFIIDDNEDYCYCNPRNAVVIKTWKYLYANDFAFENLRSYLKSSDADTAASLCWGMA